MDGVSIAASIIGIATAGVQVSIKLVTLATQISTASDRVSAIGNDISLTAGVLRQLGDLMAQETKDGSVSILNPEGLETTRTAAAMCERIFSEIEKEVKKASEQLRTYKKGLGKMLGEKIKLSTIEKTKWPFLQPRIDGLRADLRDAKSTLILLLQVATLALNKKMADASRSVGEHQDLIRAVVALELDRRIKPPEVSRSPSSNNAPNLGNSNGIYNRTPPGETVLEKDQNRSLSTYQTQPGPMYDPGTTIPQNDLPGKRKRDSLDATDSPGAGGPEAPRLPGIMEVPPNAFPGMYLAKNIIMNPPPHSSVSSENLNESAELQLFLLKPVVNDFGDRIELRWVVRDAMMQHRAIRHYMIKDENDGLPPVVEMLQQLNAYEQAMVDAQMAKDSARSILSLKRTTIDIQSRAMLFKAVPGLQFVVQCHVRQPQLQNWFPTVAHGPSLESNGFATVSNSLPVAKAHGGGHGPYSTVGTPKRRARPIEPTKKKKVDLRILNPCGQRVDEHAHDDLDVVQDQDFLDEEADAEAEAMVNDLLKQYTTFFNP